MALPPDFYWTSSSPSRPDEPATVIACDGVWVVAMAQRVDDQTWVTTMDRRQELSSVAHADWTRFNGRAMLRR